MQWGFGSQRERERVQSQNVRTPRNSGSTTYRRRRRCSAPGLSIIAHQHRNGTTACHSNNLVKCVCMLPLLLYGVPSGRSSSGADEEAYDRDGSRAAHARATLICYCKQRYSNTRTRHRRVACAVHCCVLLGCVYAAFNNVILCVRVHTTTNVACDFSVECDQRQQCYRYRMRRTCVAGAFCACFSAIVVDVWCSSMCSFMHPLYLTRQALNLKTIHVRS